MSGFRVEHIGGDHIDWSNCRDWRVKDWSESSRVEDWWVLSERRGGWYSSDDFLEDALEDLKDSIVVDRNHAKVVPLLEVPLLGRPVYPTDKSGHMDLDKGSRHLIKGHDDSFHAGAEAIHRDKDVSILGRKKDVLSRQVQTRVRMSRQVQTR